MVLFQTDIFFFSFQQFASLIVSKKVTYCSFKFSLFFFLICHLCASPLPQALAIMEVVHGKDHVYVKELQKQISTHQK